MEESNWGSMEQDIDSVSTYGCGPGAGRYPNQVERRPARQPRIGTENPLKIFVLNIPDRIDLESFRNIFSKYGNIVEAYIHKETHHEHHWGTILYDNPTSPTKAISELNGHYEYKFKIKMYIDNEKDLKFKRQQQQRSESNYETASSANYNTSVRDHPESQYASNQKLSSLQYQSPPFSPSSTNNINVLENTSGRRPAPQVGSQDQEPLPKCANCGKVTLEQCTKCFVYYCSKKCMVLGYEHHTLACITIAPHSSDKANVRQTSENCSTPVRNSGVSIRNAVMDEFRSNANDYRQYHNQNNLNQPNSYPSISNSYDNEDQVNVRNDDSSAQKKLVNNGGDATDGCRNKPQGSYPSYKEKENRAPNRNDESGARSESKWPSNSDKVVPRNDYRPRAENRDPRPSNDGTGRYNNNNRSHDSRGGHRNSSSNDDKSHDGGGSHRSGTNNDSTSNYNNNRSHDNRGGFTNGNRHNKSYEERNQNQEDASKIDNRSNGPRYNRSRDDQGSNRRYGDHQSNWQSGEKSETREDGDTKKAPENFGDDHIKFDSTPPRTSTNRPNYRDRSSADGGSDRNKFGRQTTPATPKAEALYFTDRTNPNEGDNVQVRINEMTTDTPDFCSVRIVQDEHLLPKLLADMMAETSLPPITIAKGEKCLVCRDEERIRGVIVSESPLAVKFIDTGYCAQSCNESQVKGCPDNYKSVKPFAYKVKFVNKNQIDLDSYHRENKIFEIRVVKKMRELVWEAEVLAPFSERLEGARQQRASRDDDHRGPSKNDRSYSSRSSQSRDDRPAPSRSAQSVNDSPSPSTSAQTKSVKYGEPKESEPKLVQDFVLKADKTAQMLVTFVENERTFYLAQPKDLEKISDAVSNKNFAKLEDFGKEDLCLAPQEGVLYRARVIETDPVQVYFIDFGNTDKVSKDDLKCIPANLTNIQPLAIRVRLATGTLQYYGIGEYQSHTFRFIKQDVLEKGKAWVVASEECLEVTVLHPIAPSKNEFYVMRNMDSNKLGEISSLPRKPLKSEPKIGSLYLIEYENMGWRAELINSSPPTVKYIDYGNEETIEYDRLFELSSDWERRDPLAFKIVMTVPEGTGVIKETSRLLIKTKGSDKWELLKVLS